MSDVQQARAPRAQRKTRTGTVVSDKMHKSVVVAIGRRVTHGLYGKQATRTSADDYSAILVMENKAVAKRALADADDAVELALERHRGAGHAGRADPR